MAHHRHATHGRDSTLAAAAETSARAVLPSANETPLSRLPSSAQRTLQHGARSASQQRSRCNRLHTASHSHSRGSKDKRMDKQSHFHAGSRRIAREGPAETAPDHRTRHNRNRHRMPCMQVKALRRATGVALGVGECLAQHVRPRQRWGRVAPQGQCCHPVAHMNQVHKRAQPNRKPTQAKCVKHGPTTAVRCQLRVHTVPHVPRNAK